MNRNLRLGTLATALLLVATAMYFGARPAYAICVCDTEQFATGCWGMGATEDEATAKLHPDCVANADQYCQSIGADESCQVISRLTVPAWWNGTMWQTDGDATFRCYYCAERDPRDPFIR